MKTSLPLKALFLFLLTGLLLPSNTNAQTNIFPATGKAGIGTVTPASQLEIVAPATTGVERIIKMRVTDAVDDYLEIMNATNGATVFMPAIRGAVTSINSTALYLLAETNSTNDLGVTPMTIFDSRLTAGKINNRPLFGWDSYGSRYMTLLANGNLGIGIDNPAEKLAIKGKIRAQEIKVETANWPDYVFAKDYPLPSLQQTEKHIKEKGHLPGIPSAEEVKANGVDLGEMNAKLLKKIEEITLYLIEIKKENELGKSKIEKLQEQIEKQQLDIKILKANKIKISKSKSHE